MKRNRSMTTRIVVLLLLITTLSALSSKMRADTGTCGGASITLPFTDVPASNVFFCAIAQAFFSGLTNGTSGTTYSPSANVTREQMAAFVTRTMDQSLKRGSQRAALRQFWTTQGPNNLGLTLVGSSPRLAESDGADLWVANNIGNSVSRVRASDGMVLQEYGMNAPFGVLPVMGKVFITGTGDPPFFPGRLYQIDPQLGTTATLTSGLGDGPEGIAYDGQRIWTANIGTAFTPGSVSIISLNPTSVITITAGFTNPIGIIYDGANIWVTDFGDDTIKKLDSSVVVVQTVPLDPDPGFPAFDGTNIWVPITGTDRVAVVRAIGGLAGTVIATLSDNGLHAPIQAAFDGERILVTNGGDSDSVSLWKASDLTPIGTFSTGADSDPYGVCSDGLHFWITLGGPPPPMPPIGRLARF